MNDIKFEWDHNKAQVNIEKHGITFQEASTVFLDKNAILFDDPGHSMEEEMDMREEYDIKTLNPRKNPYVKKSRNLLR